MCLLGICKPGTEAHFFIWLLSHIEFHENVKHFSTGLKFQSSLLKQAQTATSSNLIKVNTCITNDGLTFNSCVLSYFNNTARSNLTSVFLFHLPVPTATSSVFDFIFHSAHFTPVADTEKLENISCLTLSLSHRYNHHGRTQEVLEVVMGKEAGWREEETKLKLKEKENSTEI